MQFSEKLWKMSGNTDMKLAAAKRRRKYLVSEPNYNKTKTFSENLLVIEMKKSQILIYE